MIPNDPNIAVLELVVHELDALAQEFTFIGGATVGLYLNDPTAFSTVRPTQDIDCIVEVASLPKYHDVTARLKMQGFEVDTTSDINCRYRKGNLILDVMPSENLLGFKNIWYKDGLKNAAVVELPSAKRIRIFTVPYFIGSKLEAFHGRGNDDYMGSPDIEDIVTVIDGNLEFVDAVKDADTPIREYLTEHAKSLLADPRFTTNIGGHISDRIHVAQRAKSTLDKLSHVAALQPNR